MKLHIIILDIFLFLFQLFLSLFLFHLRELSVDQIKCLYFSKEGKQEPLKIMFIDKYLKRMTGH